MKNWGHFFIIIYFNKLLDGEEVSCTCFFGYSELLLCWVAAARSIAFSQQVHHALVWFGGISCTRTPGPFHRGLESTQTRHVTYQRIKWWGTWLSKWVKWARFHISLVVTAAFGNKILLITRHPRMLVGGWLYLDYIVSISPLLLHDKDLVNIKLVLVWTKWLPVVCSVPPCFVFPCHLMQWLWQVHVPSHEVMTG